MSKQLLSFLLSELKTVRILCRHPKCGATTEFDISRVDNVMADFACPVCHQKAMLADGDATTENHFRSLQAAIDGIDRARARFGVEFVLPVAEKRE
jgi:hypothetical protein